MNKKPYTKKCKFTVFVIIMVFASGIVGISISGYVINSDLGTGFSTLTCGVVSVVDIIAYGDGEKKTWVGIDPAIKIINNLP